MPKLTEQELDQSAEIISRALAGGSPLFGPVLTEALRSAGYSPELFIHRLFITARKALATSSRLPSAASAVDAPVRGVPQSAPHVVQISATSYEGVTELFALMSDGRLFKRDRYDRWLRVELPLVPEAV